MATILEMPTQSGRKVVLSGVSWDAYERLLAEYQDSAITRFAYDRGTLEIMILSLRHERLRHGLATLVEFTAEELQIDVEGAGSTTFRREDLERGFEPDACFYFKDAEYIRRKDEIDLTIDPPPELVIEIDITSPSLNKFPIFAAIGVAEVWRYGGGQVSIFRLSGSEYVNVAESVALPGVTGTLVSRLLAVSQTMKRTEWLSLVRESVKQPAKDA